jgi:hypothetical protein
MVRSGRVIGKCWNCRGPVYRGEGVWLPDYSTLNYNTHIPVKRLLHRGQCEQSANLGMGRIER